MKRTPTLTKKREPKKSAKPLPDTRILEALCSVLLVEVVRLGGSEEEIYGAVHDVARPSGCSNANSNIKAVFRRINDGVKYQYEHHWGDPAPDAVNELDRYDGCPVADPITMKRRGPQTSDGRGLHGLLQKVVAAIERAYEFAPSHYTWEARSAAHALAKEIRKESTQPKG